MKSIDDALELRGRIFGAFELAELVPSSGEEIDRLLTFVVVGAGPTGVEMAGQIAELAHRTLRRDFRRDQHPRRPGSILLDAAPQVLPPFGAKLGEKTKTELEKLGVEVQLGAMVTDVDERGIEVQYKDGTRRAHRGGHQDLGRRRAGQPAGQDARRADRRPARPRRPDQREPRPHAAGPPRGVRGRRHDRPRPPARRRAGRDPGREVRRQGDQAPARRASRRRSRSSTSTRAAMATICRFRAVAMVGKLRLTGFIAWLMWLAVHLRLPHRLQEPGHRAAALGGLLPRPRPLGAHRHRAADLRPQRRCSGSSGGAADLVSSPGDYDATRSLLEADAGAPSSRRGRPRRPGSPTPASACHHEDAPRPDPARRQRRGPDRGPRLTRLRDLGSASSSMTWTAASSALAPAPSMPTSSPTRSSPRRGRGPRPRRPAGRRARCRPRRRRPRPRRPPAA